MYTSKERNSSVYFVYACVYAYVYVNVKQPHHLSTLRKANHSVRICDRFLGTPGMSLDHKCDAIKGTACETYLAMLGLQQLHHIVLVKHIVPIGYQYAVI